MQAGGRRFDPAWLHLWKLRYWYWYWSANGRKRSTGAVDNCEIRGTTLGVFEFVIALVLISTVGKVARDRREIRTMDKSTSQIGPGAFEGLRDTVEEMNTRLRRIEEERDFYRDLLESPQRPHEILNPVRDVGKEEQV